MKIPTLLALSLLNLCAWPALAQDDHHGHGAHVHGIAAMTVAVDGQQVQITLETPLDNVLGFEHAPKNDKERQAVQSMGAKFRTPETLLVFNPEARCVASEVNLESAALPAKLLNPTQQEAPKADQGTEGHGDLDVDLSFTCANGPKTLEVKLFTAFPHLKKLDVQIAGPGGQSAAQLTPRNYRLQIK